MWSPRQAQSRRCWGSWPLSHRMRAAVPTHSHSQGPGKGTHPPHPQTEGLSSRSFSQPPPRPGLLGRPAPRAAGAQGSTQPSELTRRLFILTGLRATRQPASEESRLGDNGKQPALWHPVCVLSAHGTSGPLRAGRRHLAASAGPAAARWPAGGWLCRPGWPAAPESGSFLLRCKSRLKVSRPHTPGREQSAPRTRLD